ncbi:60s ribosomal protein l28-like [Lynx pardinus]|uniref:60s ribosomal protein l28-like n=1 Tax=Lynx pardinus TaxID=191816 RepID=A0A485P5J2_LYNPA|nr:60s ribosomal protein l28-like [Lynx pardinus]
MEPVANGEGVVVVTEPPSGQRKLTTSSVWTTINEQAWATLSSIRHMIPKEEYCPDPPFRKPVPSCTARSLSW